MENDWSAYRKDGRRIVRRRGVGFIGVRLSYCGGFLQLILGRGGLWCGVGKDSWLSDSVWCNGLFRLFSHAADEMGEYPPCEPPKAGEVTSPAMTDWRQFIQFRVGREEPRDVDMIRAIQARTKKGRSGGLGLSGGPG